MQERIKPDNLSRMGIRITLDTIHPQTHFILPKQDAISQDTFLGHPHVPTYNTDQYLVHEGKVPVPDANPLVFCPVIKYVDSSEPGLRMRSTIDISSIDPTEYYYSMNPLDLTGGYTKVYMQDKQGNQISTVGLAVFPTVEMTDEASIKLADITRKLPSLERPEIIQRFLLGMTPICSYLPDDSVVFGIRDYGIVTVDHNGESVSEDLKEKLGYDPKPGTDIEEPDFFLRHGKDGQLTCGTQMPIFDEEIPVLLMSTGITVASNNFEIIHREMQRILQNGNPSYRQISEIVRPFVCVEVIDQRETPPEDPDFS